MVIAELLKQRSRQPKGRYVRREGDKARSAPRMFSRVFHASFEPVTLRAANPKMGLDNTIPELKIAALSHLTGQPPVMVFDRIAYLRHFVTPI